MLVDKTGVKGLRGTPLVAAITSVCSAAFLLFGYDQGVMSGVILSKSWLSEMDDPSTTMTGTITALYDIGAVLGALGASVTAEGLGRKRGLICGSVLLILGSTFMGAANGRALMIVGRIFTGLGTLSCSSICLLDDTDKYRHWLYHVCRARIPERGLPDHATRLDALLPAHDAPCRPSLGLLDQLCNVLH